jgi:hypothetical protein
LGAWERERKWILVCASRNINKNCKSTAAQKREEVCYSEMLVSTCDTT